MTSNSLAELLELDYPVRIEFDKDDHLYVAEFLDLPGCSATGETVADAYKEVQAAKEDWLRLALEQGLPIPPPSKTEDYSGRVLLRIPTSLHATVADKARLHGTSLNQYLVHLISGSVVQDAFNDKLDEMKAQIERLDWRIAKVTTDLSHLSAHTSMGILGATTGMVYAQTGNVYSAVVQNTYTASTIQQGILLSNCPQYPFLDLVPEVEQEPSLPNLFFRGSEGKT
jgi:antitoxin HicB